MTKVIVRNGNVDGALKSFKQKVVKNGLLKEVREREHYSKRVKEEKLKRSYQNSVNVSEIIIKAVINLHKIERKIICVNEFKMI